jgi:hypothetical protein
VPYFEEGIREDVIREWRKEGLPAGKYPDDIFLQDNFLEIQLEINPLPDFDRWPSSADQLGMLRERFNSNDPSRFPGNWREIIKKTADEDTVVFLRVHRGFFQSMGIHKWDRFSDVMFMILEDPQFVHAWMSIHGEFLAEFFDRVLQQINIDAAVFSEAIGGNEGPLISPEMYEEFALEHYKPLIGVLDSHGVKIRICRTYANSRILIPSLLNYGINCLWACETNTESMDYIALRNEFGEKLRLIGGIDLDALRLGRQAIAEEMHKIPVLLEGGGYIPLADGRIRKEISFDNYSYYRNLLEKIISES